MHAAELELAELNAQLNRVAPGPDKEELLGKRKSVEEKLKKCKKAKSDQSKKSGKKQQ